MKTTKQFKLPAIRVAGDVVAMNIYLIGMRAAGKSSVGRQLAQQLNRSFIDMDRELVAEFDQSISDFVGTHGWTAFRRREEALLARIANMQDRVVATGGGVICAETNIALMRATGWVVWLNAGLETLKQRLNTDCSTSGMRPALGNTDDAAAELVTLIQARRPAYQKAMHAAVDTEGRSVEMVCREILEKYDSK